jgi:hypothetical protein
MGKKPKRPRDPNQVAKFIVDVATGEADLAGKSGDGKNPDAVQLGRLGGKKGGNARAAGMTPAQRTAIARKAAEARWGRHHKADTPSRVSGWAARWTGQERQDQLAAMKKMKDA